MQRAVASPSTRRIRLLAVLCFSSSSVPPSSLAGRGSGGEEEVCASWLLTRGDRRDNVKLRSRRSLGVHHQKLFNDDRDAPSSC
jgi:hypothetical protein